MAELPMAKHREGCMVCGTALEYASEESAQRCTYCGREHRSAMRCPAGHFVCDACHGADAAAVMASACIASATTDMAELLAMIRAHPSISVHGPEHHGMIAGILVAACRNAGADVTDDMIRKAIDRGLKVPGGSCGYLGVCGAASGIGTGFAVLLRSTPRDGATRQEVLRAVGEALRVISEHPSARCCQRDGYLALGVAAKLAPGLVGVSPTTDFPLVCSQTAKNKECAGTDCPLHPPEHD